MQKDIAGYKKFVWGLSALLVLFPIFQMLQIQSEESSSVVLGLSLSRLLLLISMLTVGILFGSMAFFGEKLAQRFPVLFGDAGTASTRTSLLLVGTIFFLWLGFGGGHDFVDLQALYLRLKPVFQYFGLVLALWVGYAYLKNYSSNEISAKTKIERFNLPFTLLTLATFLIILAFIHFTGIGITPGYPYWGEAGTLIWGYQVILSLVLAFFLAIVLKGLIENHPARFDLAAFIILWGAAAMIWNLADMGHNFFAPRQFVQPYYPYSDAALYDVNAYSILIGKGVSFVQYTFRPIYIGFLALLHALSGPNYTVLIGLQTAVYGLYAPGLYLLGREMHSRKLGFAIAFLGIISQLNSFVANEFVRVSNPKLLLTEFPTTVILVYVAYFFIAGIKKSQSGKKWVIAFGLLGVAFLIRLHVAVVLVCLLGLMFVIDKRLKVQLRNSLVIGGLAVLIVLPWMFRNYLSVGAFSLDPGRFNLLLENRWGEPVEGNVRNNVRSVPTKSNFLQLSLVDSAYSQALVSGETLQEMLAHFLHNEVLSVMDLPQSIRFMLVRNYYQTDYYLTGEWTGELTPEGKIFLITNLVILSIGIGTAYKKRGLLGLVPLVIHSSYHFANALVRTSGWRYLIPTEWVPMLYYVLGLLQLLLWFRAKLFPSDETPIKEPVPEFSIPPMAMKSFFQAGAGFVFLSVLVSFGPALIPDQFPPLTSQGQQAYFELVAENSDLTLEKIQQFSSKEGAIFQVGKVLYPRFYYPDEGIFHYRSEVVDYSRVEFTLINDWVYQVRVPIGNGQNYLTHEMDVGVLGCKGQESHIEALLIFPLEVPHPEVMINNTGWAETCPLPTP